MPTDSRATVGNPTRSGRCALSSIRSEAMGRVARVLVVGIAVLAEAVLVVPFSVFSGLFAPSWAYLVYVVVAVGAVITQVLLIRRRRWLFVLLVPVAHGLFYFGTLTLGDLFLGWTA